MTGQLTFAVPKGRLLEEALPLMERAGLVPEASFHDKGNRALSFKTNRDDMRLIAVVMGTASEQARAAETQKLLTWGFRFFETRHFYQPGEVVSTARVWAGKDSQVDAGLAEGLVLTLPKGQGDKLEASVTLDSVIKAPIAVGDVLGQVEVRMGEEVVHTGPLVADKMHGPLALFSGSSGTAAAKMDALQAAGVRVGQNPTEAGELMVEVVREHGWV